MIEQFGTAVEGGSLSVCTLWGIMEGKPRASKHENYTGAEGILFYMLCLILLRGLFTASAMHTLGLQENKSICFALKFFDWLLLVENKVSQ